jgi:hypothetical protein
MSEFRATPGRLGVVVLASLTLLSIVTSCSVRDEMLLHPDGSGEVHVSVDMHPVLMAYFTDLMMALTGAEGDPPIYDLDALSASFAERPGVTLVSADTPERGALRLHVRFEDINQLFADEDSAETARFSSSGSRRELVVTLNRASVNRFLGYAPEDSSMLADLLLPPEDGSLPSEDYRGELEWAFEEYGTPDEVADALDSAVIEVRITPDGRIVTQSGGSIVGDSVVFRIPVLELLTLDDERVYSLSFTP